MNCMCHIVCTGENTYIIISLTITPIKKLNFLTGPDLAFSFFNKRSGNKIKRLVYNKLKAKLLLSSATYFYILPYSLCEEQILFMLMKVGKQTNFLLRQ